MDKITIIGLGLIGGSIGLGLKQKASDKVEISGYDKDLETGRKAEKLKAVDKSHWKLEDAVKDAKMVIIATPVLAIREMLELISDMAPPGCVVTDTGSTKTEIMAWAEEYLPREVSFVGGHPMAGKEVSGIDAADANLFQNARYAVIPGVRAREEAVRAVLGMVELLEAKPYFLDAVEHDSFVAAVSHLPIIVSSALVSVTTKSPSWREMSRMAATGYRDVSRLASGDPVMNLDISVTNRDNLLYWVEQAIQELRHYHDMIGKTSDESGLEALGDTFTKVWADREKWLVRYESGEEQVDELAPSGPEVPSFGDQMIDMVVGTKIRERYKEIISMQQRRPQREERRRRG